MNAYSKEKKNWLDTDAIQIVPTNAIPHDSTTLSSHVVYKYKPNGSLKARIVPHGNKDPLKNSLRKDVPCMKPEQFRLLCSISAEKGWAICEMDVKSAYLQADGYEREVYILPPTEDKNRSNAWLLKRPAYGLVDSGRLWYLTSDKALISLGLTRCSNEHSTYYAMDETGLAFLVVVQVDNYIYSGTTIWVEKFESFMKRRFHIGECLHGDFEVYGCRVSQTADKIVVSQKDRLLALRGYDFHPDRANMGNDDATEAERTGYLSIIGSLLFIGSVTSPIISRVASSFATRTHTLKVKDVKALNSLLKYSKGLSATITFRRPTCAHATLSVFTDASHASAVDVRSHQGTIMFRTFGTSTDSVAHPVAWTSHKIRRIVRSTLAAETISCADGVDMAIYLNSIMGRFCMDTLVHVFVDSKSLSELLSTSHDPEERRLKLDLAALREAFELGDLHRVSWVPSRMQLADSLTKDNRQAAAILDATISNGLLRGDYSAVSVKKSPFLLRIPQEKRGSGNDSS